MRHRKSFNHLSRTKSHRKAMLSNMAASLILHKRIKTTTAKAKALKLYVEPLITKSKDDSTHSRRVVFSYLQNKDAVSELFREVSPKIMDRPGGYTRILKIGNRLGDNADMCFIELVDYNENLLTAKDEAQAKSGRRRRRGGKKKSGEESASVGTVEAAPIEKSEETEVEQTSAEASVAEDVPAEKEVAAEELTEEETEAVAEEVVSPVEEETEPEAEKVEVSEEKEEIKEEEQKEEVKAETKSEETEEKEDSKEDDSEEDKKA